MSEKIRVLRVIARLNIGGPAIHATVLTERLDPGRYDSLLVSGVESSDEGSYLSLHKRSVERLMVIPKLGREIHPVRDVMTFFRLFRLIRRIKPHIVHTHTAKAGTLGRIAAKLAGVPVIVHTYHGHVLSGYFPGWKSTLFTWIERGLACLTDRLIAVSEAVRQDLLALGIGSAEKVTVVPLGLDLSPFLASDALRGRVRRELKIDRDVPLVGIVARLVPIKRHEDFLAAAALVSKRIPGARFLVIGDGERRDELSQLRNHLGLGERVSFLGWRSDLDAVYADLDLAVLTSENEGSPVSLIEAMAAARPVVATRVGGVPDLVEDGVTGFTVPPRDPEAIADAVVELLNDPLRRRTIGQAGRKRAHPAFGVERLLEDVDRLYTSLLLESGGGDGRKASKPIESSERSTTGEVKNP